LSSLPGVLSSLPGVMSSLPGVMSSLRGVINSLLWNVSCSSDYDVIKKWNFFHFYQKLFNKTMHIIFFLIKEWLFWSLHHHIGWVVLITLSSWLVFDEQVLQCEGCFW
jgi:hypothetical protein